MMTVDLSLRMESLDGFESALFQVLQETEGVEGVTIALPPGEFLLENPCSFRTFSIAHDDGCGENEEKSACLVLRDRKRFALRGSKGDDGEPRTILLVAHDGQEQCLKPSAIWAEDCPGLRLENLELRMASPTSFFGVVVEKGEDYLLVDPGCSGYPEEMPLYCMNRFRDGRLVGKSLTIGFGVEERMVRQEDGRYLLRSAALAEKVEVGDDLSWHLSGKTDFLVFLGHCDDLRMENIRISDASGFGILTECCRNITAEKVVVRSREGYQPVSRDGWKVFRCSGRVEVTSSWFEGTRMDGQNVHGNYLVVKEVRGDKVLGEMKYAPSSISAGSWVEFDGLGKKAQVLSCRLVSSEFRETRQEGDTSAAKAVVGKKNRFNLYELELDRMPSGVHRGSYASLEEFTVEEYISKGSVFRNIAGCGNLIRARRALVEGNTYENIMNAGVLVGAEWDTHAESMNPEGVMVKDCSFSNVGFSPRYGDKGMGGVAAAAQGFGDQPVIGSLQVEGCLFSDLGRAVELRNVKEATLCGNVYRNVSERLVSEGVEKLEAKDCL